VHAPAREGVERHRRHRRQGLAFAGLHLHEPPAGEGDAGEHLHVVGALPQHPPGDLTHQGEAWRQESLERHARESLAAQGRGPLAQLRVSGAGELRLQSGDGREHLGRGLERRGCLFHVRIVYPLAVRPKLFQPFRLQVRLSLWLLWALIAVSVITIGSRSPVPNHPVGLLLLGLGLAASGLLALLALTVSTVWTRLIDPEFDAGKARTHLYVVVGLGAVGAVMTGFALDRLF
jgi:hypothetical protein